ncbi:WXG100 family type VII secretion target [Cryptosporangium minutisporangium]|uniref:WXG100 family type VII secretion target n=1 Tax=Cryptosporangium minutisporangium TaxID=113569 RepID=UPI0035EED141
MGDDKYYGYSSGENEQLADLRVQGRRMGENFTEYGDSSVGSQHFQDYQQTYKPTGNPSESMTQESYDYYNKKDGYGRTGASGSGIEAIYKRIMGQKPEKVQALIHHWKTIAENLRTVGDTLKQQSDGVSKSWKSPGAQQFLALGPGAALKSINDWQEAADQTAAALGVVLSALTAKQAEIGRLYKQYLDEVAAWHKELEIKGPEEVKNAEDLYTKHLAEMHQKYTYPAQVIESSLGDAYWDGYNGVVSSTPGIYEGPTNAVVAPPGLFLDAPTLPGGVPGGPAPVVPPGLTPPTPVNALNVKPPAPAPPIAPGKAPVGPVTPVVPVNATPPPPVAPPAVGPVGPGVPPVAPTVLPPSTILPPKAPGVGPAPVPGQPALPTPPLAPAKPPVNVAKAMVKGVLKPGVPGGAPGAPNLPMMPGRTTPNVPSPMPPGGRAAGDPRSRLARPVLGGSGPRDPGAPPPPMPNAGRRPTTPNGPGGLHGFRAGGPGGPGGPGGLPPSPFGGPRQAAPPVLGGRTGPRRPGVPGLGGPGSTDRPAGLAPPPPGATRPVLDRRDAPPPPPPGRERPARPQTFRPGPANPFGASRLTMPATPVLNQAIGHRPASALPVGVPDALRGAAPGGADGPTGAERPVFQADLAARHHGADPLVGTPADAPVTPDGVPVVRDEDVFAPVTPGGPVLAHGSTPKEYEPSERVALPGQST